MRNLILSYKTNLKSQTNLKLKWLCNVIIIGTLPTFHQLSHIATADETQRRFQVV